MCDVESRQKLGPKRSNSVFFAPCKEAVFTINKDFDFKDSLKFKKQYTLACELNSKNLQKKISMQAFCICPKIVETHMFLEGIGSELKDKIKESHPEICFYGFKEACRYSKKNKKGIEERLSIINEISKDAYQKIKEFTENMNTKEINIDDVIDSVILALSAERKAKLVSLPSNINDGNTPAIFYYDKRLN